MGTCCSNSVVNIKHEIYKIKTCNNEEHHYKSDSNKEIENKNELIKKDVITQETNEKVLFSRKITIKNFSNRYSSSFDSDRSYISNNKEIYSKKINKNGSTLKSISFFNSCKDDSLNVCNNKLNSTSKFETKRLKSRDSEYLSSESF